MPRPGKVDEFAILKRFYATAHRFETATAALEDVAEHLGISRGVCRRVLLAHGVCFGKRDVVDMAARDHTVRRVLMALSIKGSMGAKDIERLPGCSDSRPYIQHLLRERYLSMTRNGKRRVYALTEHGQRLVTEADELYVARQPDVLAARRDAGDSIKDIARDVGLSVRTVQERMQARRRRDDAHVMG